MKISKVKESNTGWIVSISDITSNGAEQLEQVLSNLGVIRSAWWDQNLFMVHIPYDQSLHMVKKAVKYL